MSAEKLMRGFQYCSYTILRLNHQKMRLILSQFEDNKNHITEVLAANDLECDDLASIYHANTMFLSNYIEEIVVTAISQHLMNKKDLEYRNGKLVISSESFSHGLSLFQEERTGRKDTLKLETNEDSSKDGEGKGVGATTKTQAPENKTEGEKSLSAGKKDGDSAPPPKAEVPQDNEFERCIRPEVIPANEIGVTFVDIGAMDDIKELLHELVMLPL